MLSLDRINFINILEQLRAGLAKEAVFDQSNCFVFTGGRVWTYNGEVYGRAVSGLPDEYNAAIPSKPLLSLLQKADGDSITVELDNPEEIVIHLGPDEEMAVRTEQEITLPVGQIDRVKAWSKLPSSFVDAVLVTSSCTAKRAEEGFVYMTCLNVTTEFIEGFDNQHCCRYQLPMTLSGSFQVRAEGFRTLAELSPTLYQETDSWLHLGNRSGVVIGHRKFVYEFPDLNEFMMQEGVKTALPKMLTEVTEKAEVFAAQDRDFGFVTVDLKPKNKTQAVLTMQSRSDDGRYKFSRTVAYGGQPIRFFIKPKMLKYLLENFDDFHVAPNVIIVQSDHWRYVASLEMPDAAATGEDSED